MPRPTAALKERTQQILDTLEKTHPDARCALEYRTAFELLGATILSAQCTDERVNMVTPVLFDRYKDAQALAAAEPQELEGIIKSTGFFRAKAKSLMGMAAGLVADHGGRVPQSMDALVKLPGVGRKTANVVLGHVWDINEGIAVDTHVLRVSNRLGIAAGEDPVDVEQQLMRIVPRERWTRTTDLLIFHGRRICDARRPRCGRCPIYDLCRFPARSEFAARDAAEAAGQKPVEPARSPRKAPRPSQKARQKA